MGKSESISQFYDRVPAANPNGLAIDNSGSGHFNVFERSGLSGKSPYSRRDFYKISFIIGSGIIYYADKWIAIDKPALLFSNPAIPYSWEPASDEQSGWYCLFTEFFIPLADRLATLHNSPLFRVGGNPVYFLNPQQQADIADLFQKMIKEINTDYNQKYAVLGNYLHILLHEALKMDPSVNFERHSNAANRIASLFLELLERQFPVDSLQYQFRLKTATDYARNLSVHVNHLNRSVKEITGKTTTEHIAARTVTEAKALLQHTDWNIAEIAFSLGFEYPAYFTNFFKKHTGRTPNEARNNIV